ncbi:hypothetical protein CEUSTIGMA_g2686.t1 [Chlamydomonas eustigma]|uniref:Uncharacterized protein n=1 Tax=Chlamydomonas eustigma TaxID=1157962 RepID=A0A250WWP7_9CHLO|nr:hypothetical protein CEUSTIGMA_g2686.t1 [Chlamydomonas eustigma]|eukprot:GAX75241.1 hypothetical protein CEUSTIGMA_g2686.t1 [Chlamydomonas eustigma]
MEAAVKSSLKDASKIAFWDDDGRIYYSNFQTNAEELRGLARVLGDRESAIKQGMVAGGVRYEVHRHHPPAVYGRTMDGALESSEGAAVYKVEPGLCGRPCYGFISYKFFLSGGWDQDHPPGGQHYPPKTYANIMRN